jgi:dynein intermediate chain 1
MFEKTKKKHVTAVKWNPEFSDLFAVGYGSFDFMKQGGGMLCLFSLKNPSWPEFSCSVHCGVMCLDWHPQHSSVLCVGLYDGTVCVYDVRSKTQAPIYQSTVKTGKHTDPVWEVCWQEEDLAKNLNFFSISSDGRVTLWTLAKSELEFADLMQLKLIQKGAAKAGEEEEDSALLGLAGGCCFDFSKLSEHLFLVGTEEGWIHKCSKAYNSEYLGNYAGHYMAVYTVRWNPFHHKVFASCSADWTAKLWDHTHMTALLSFDLNVQVGDLAWSPWSSTTFACCTADGKVHVFDLNENKNEPYCEQKAVRKAKLTKIAFNAKVSTPIIAVGDDHGCVTTMKPSPNLRWTAITKAEAEAKAKADAEANAAGGPRKAAKKAAPAPGEEGAAAVDPRQLEIQKFDKLLEQAHKNQIHSE